LIYIKFVAKQFTLGKSERLKSRALIEQVFDKGKKISLPGFRIHFLNDFSASSQPTAVIQFGVSVPVKNFKKAVERNRIKRLIRESYRVQKNELKKLLAEKNLRLVLFFIYTNKEMPDQAYVSDKMKLALQKIIAELGN
jgi:ribonuclease P protein component